MLKNITILKVEVGKEPEVVTVEHSLESLQNIVGGWLEAVYITNDIIMIVNEEGMIQDLPVNFLTSVLSSLEEGAKGIKLNPVEPIHGNVFFVSAIGEDFASLDKIQIKRIKKMFSFSRDALITNI